MDFGVTRETYEQELWGMMSNGTVLTYEHNRCYVVMLCTPHAFLLNAPLMMSSTTHDALSTTTHSSEDSNLQQEHTAISGYLSRTMSSVDRALPARKSASQPGRQSPSGVSLQAGPTNTSLARVPSTHMPVIAEAGLPQSLAAPSPFEEGPGTISAATSAEGLLHMPLLPFAHRALHLLRQEASALQAYRALLELDLRHLLVVDKGGGVPVGIVTRKDLHNAMHS